MNTDNIPFYVMICKTEMRLVNGMYYRDAGQWYVRYKFMNGILVTDSELEHLDNLEIIEITRAEWKKGNEGHINKEL